MASWSTSLQQVEFLQRSAICCKFRHSSGTCSKQTDCFNLCHSTPNPNRTFADGLIEAELSPVSQHPVSQYFFDSGTISKIDSRRPVRLAIEINSREEYVECSPYRSIVRSTRDRVLQCFGRRPLYFWEDEINDDTTKWILTDCKGTFDECDQTTSTWETYD